jgi:hypothetical protein
MVDDNQTFMIEDAEIIFRNFEGREGQYNLKGQRNFCVVLPPDVAQVMVEDGWNVRYLDPRDEGEDPKPYIAVGVRFDVYPPRIVLITASSRTQLDEESVSILDWADIETADLIARGFNWNVGGKSGTKAYLQSLFVTIREDALERKYAINENPPQK